MRADDSPQAMSKLENGAIRLNDLFEKSETTKAALAGKKTHNQTSQSGFWSKKKKKKSSDLFRKGLTRGLMQITSPK